MHGDLTPITNLVEWWELFFFKCFNVLLGDTEVYTTGYIETTMYKKRREHGKNKLSLIQLAEPDREE